jgi:hypothetical protein
MGPMIGYWDPMPTARRLIDGLDKPTERLFTGRWEERNWRNVPGPFYASETDSLQIGRLAAPDHVCYDDDIGNGFGYEFIYRQPVNVPETEAEWKAAGSSCTAVTTGTVATIGRWGPCGSGGATEAGCGSGQLRWPPIGERTRIRIGATTPTPNIWATITMPPKGTPGLRRLS